MDHTSHRLLKKLHIFRLEVQSELENGLRVDRGRVKTKIFNVSKILYDGIQIGAEKKKTLEAMLGSRA